MAGFLSPATREQIRAARLAPLLVCVSTSLVACRARPEGLREWRPEDHDHAEEDQKLAAGAASANPAAVRAAGMANVVDAAWTAQCASCHGLSGRGDGPQGPMLRARDFTDAAWQRDVKNEQLAEAIAKGRGKMPAFELPPEMIAALVQKVRSFGAR